MSGISKGEVLSAVSPCGKFVGIVSIARSTVEIYAVESSSVYRSYDLNDSLRDVYGNGVEQMGNVKSLVLTQFTWEPVSVGLQSSKFGVVVDNYAVLLMFDIRDDHNKPIIIQQSMVEGIDRFQWIPEAIGDDEKQSGGGGYVNCKQVVVFTKFNLHMKLYSLDCTHILVTILKPLTNEILIRPNKGNKYWSIVASPVEYNAHCSIYHFYNKGSISSLFQIQKLPFSIITACSIHWSSSGSWLSFFDESSKLYGFEMNVVPFLSTQLGGETTTTTTTNAEPILTIKHLSDELSTSSGKVELANTNYVDSWINTKSSTNDNNECILVASISDRYEFELLVYSISTLRLVRKTGFNQEVYGTGWVQTADSNAIKYRQSTNITLADTTIKKIHSEHSTVILQVSNTVIILQLIDGPELKYITSIQYNSDIVSVSFVNSNSFVVVTDTHIIDYDLTTNKLSIPYSGTTSTLKDATAGEERLIILQDNKWQVINKGTKSESETDFKPQVFPRLKRNRPDTTNRLTLLSNSFTADEITDTFDVRKRPKRSVI
ncbi:uncharacterized protein RJT21DRAFT_34742 [Scheffersomyces amazonensis]|uniref:uncharacterized protein n=1 Tax=Scheffersomyces amazonensis TaxID=1078765 RepID=UPI00315DC7FA